MREIDAIRRIHNRTGRFLKMKELNSPQVILAKERVLIRKAVNLWLDSLEDLLAEGFHDA
jgi:hypothetical protein